MRLVKPKMGGTPDGGGPSSGYGGSFHPWLREWIANKGAYALLSCGCKEDVNHATTLVVGKDHAIICWTHDEWVKVEKRLTFNEYAGLPPEVNTQEPLF